MTPSLVPGSSGRFGASGGFPSPSVGSMERECLALGGAALLVGVGPSPRPRPTLSVPAGSGPDWVMAYHLDLGMQAQEIAGLVPEDFNWPRIR